MREYLSDRPLKEISGLPYTEEEYERGKEMLKSRCGVEIVQAHGRKIVNLPALTSVNLKKIFQSTVESQCIIIANNGKLDTAEILVSETLDKLAPISRSNTN